MSIVFNDSQPKKKEFNKNIAINDISQDQIAQVFEDNFETFIILMLSQYQPKFQKGIKKLNQSLNKIDNNNLINICERIISINWNNKHPFMSILYSTYAKALYKNTINRKEENKINMFFLKSTDIARDSLGELNIFYGKLTRDIGLFFEKNLKFTEAHNMFSFAYKVYNKHKKRFKKEYFYSLKHLTKNCVNLGQLKDGLDYGIQLVEEIVKEKEKIYGSKAGIGLSTSYNWSANDVKQRLEVVRRANIDTFAIWQAPVPSDWWPYLKEFVNGN